jgi:hypothetical protein
MPITDRDCVQYARECVWLARVVRDLEIREQLFDMAREWMAAAMHEITSTSRASQPPACSTKAPHELNGQTLQVMPNKVASTACCRE